jgi:hypothetical protein
MYEFDAAVVTTDLNKRRYVLGISQYFLLDETYMQ